MFFFFSYLQVHVEKPSQVTFPLLSCQGPDYAAGWPVHGSVTMETACLLVIFNTERDFSLHLDPDPTLGANTPNVFKITGKTTGYHEAPLH